MPWALIGLFLFTIVYEVMIVVSTTALIEKRLVLSPTLSALLELAKLVSLLFVIDSKNKVLAIAVVMIACYLGNYGTLVILKRLEKKKQLK